MPIEMEYIIIISYRDFLGRQVEVIIAHPNELLFNH